MLIQPGVGLPSTSNFIELVPINSKRRIDITLLNDAGELADISEVMLPSGDADGELSVTITSLGGTTVLSDSFWPNPVPTSRRIKHTSLGKYYLQLGDTASETATSGTYVANWTVRESASTETVYQTQVIEVVTPRVLSLIPRLRYAVDRSLKPVVPENGCFLGYQDSQLVMCLRSGLDMINQYQPTISWANLDSFPIESFAEILLRSATHVALESQMIFAIDSDITAFSTASHSFTINHFQPLSAYLAQLRASLDVAVPRFKLIFVNSGTALIEARPDMAFAALLNAAPYGGLYRGMYAIR